MSADLRSRVNATIVAGVTEPPAPRPRLLRRGRVDLVFVVDVVLAAILVAISDRALEAQNAAHRAGHSTDMLLLISIVLCAPLILRNRFPLSSWTTSALAVLWASLLIPPRSMSASSYLPTGVIVYVLCLYAVAVRCKTWVAAGTGVITVAGAALIDHRTAVVAVGIAALPVFTGVIVRSRRGSREELEVAERRHEGERALLEERQRIARELHDVVAHHMSVIAIQAEAAPYKTADPPPELVESFAEIRASALSGLTELRRVLGVLRSDRADIAPQPGLGDLDALAESARGAGVTVTTSITGVRRPLTEGVDLSAYRIVQEALSNAIRHAPGSAVQVSLFYGQAALVIEVRNDGGSNGIAPAQPAAEQPGPDGPGVPGGHGIVGMRERATMLGGHLDARLTPAGDFLVTAALPLAPDRLEVTP